MEGWIFDRDGARRTKLANIEQVRELRDAATPGSAVWIDVRGLSDSTWITGIGHLFELHPLVMEDVVNVAQRPKAEIHDDDCIVVVMREPCGGPPFDSEQIAIVIGPRFVLSFQEPPGDILDPVRKRLLEGSRSMHENRP